MNPKTSRRSFLLYPPAKMFPLIKPVNIFEDCEQVFGEETYYYLVVYGEFEDKDESFLPHTIATMFQLIKLVNIF